MHCQNPLSFFFLILVIHDVVVHMKKPLNSRCHMKAPWIFPIMFLHALYIAILVGFLAAIRHIEFRFNELKDLLKGIVVSASSIGTPSE